MGADDKAAATWHPNDGPAWARSWGVFDHAAGEFRTVEPDTRANAEREAELSGLTGGSFLAVDEQTGLAMQNAVNHARDRWRRSAAASAVHVISDAERLREVHDLVLPGGIPKRTTIPALAAIIGGVCDLVPDARWLEIMAEVRELVANGGPR